MELPDLPKNWAKVPLEALADVSAGNPAPQGEANFAEDGVPFVRVQDMGRLKGKYLRVTADRVNEQGSQKLRLWSAGTVLLTKSGASTLLNQRAILGQDSFVVSHIATVAANGTTSADWLYYWLKMVDAAKLSHGGNMPSLPLSRVKQTQCPLPPLAEQQRIVEKIETLFAELDKGEDALREVQNLLVRYRQSVLKAAVAGELTANWRAANGPPPESGENLLARILKQRRETWRGRGSYNEPTKPNTRNLPELPDGWTWASIDQISVEMLIGLVRAAGLQNTQGIGTRYIKMDRIDMHGHLALDTDVCVNVTSQEGERFALQKNDVLFNTRNSVELVGKVGIVAKTPDQAIVYNNNLMRLRFVEATSPAFLNMQMTSPGVRKRMELVKRATTSVAAIYGKDLKQLALAIPPLAEQHEIAARTEEALARVRQVLELCDAERSRSAALRQSILKNGFSGRLVPQDPCDEPAEQLLARVRDARVCKMKPARKVASA